MFIATFRLNFVTYVSTYQQTLITKLFFFAKTRNGLQVKFPISSCLDINWVENHRVNFVTPTCGVMKQLFSTGRPLFEKHSGFASRASNPI